MTINTNQDNENESRFIQKENLWYFKTRERRLMGPYMSLNDATEAVEVYVALMDIHGSKKKSAA